MHSATMVDGEESVSGDEVLSLWVSVVGGSISAVVG